MRVRTYVISTDRGGAPNYDPPAPTLTICKPRIRRNARVGELILAFTGESLSPEPHSIRWAGVVGEIIPFAQYWTDPRFSTKKPDRSGTPDNIYRPEGHSLVQVPNPSHHAANESKDVSGLHALVFSSFWYLGQIEALPERFGLRMVGNRRSEPKHTLSEALWAELRAWLDERAGPLPRFSTSRQSASCHAVARHSAARARNRC